MDGTGAVTVQAVVIGAGPAGCSAALCLAREGIDVALLDRGPLPGDKVCGDGLSPLCMAVLGEMGLSSLVDRVVQATTAHVVAPNGESAVLVPGRMGGLLPRAELEAALLEHARAAGARLFAGARAVRVARGPQGVGVETARGPAFSGSWAVLATGAGPQGLRVCGLGGRRAQPAAIGRRAYFEGADLPPRTILFSYEPTLLPAYGWIFALGGGAANVGVMDFVRPGRRRAPSLTDRFKSFVHGSATCRRFLSRARQAGPAGSAPLRMGFEGGLFGDGRLLVAGDAAGGANPLTGEGIHAALVTGRLAGQCIVRALRQAVPAEQTLADYRAAVRGAFGRDYARARLMRRLMTRPAVVNRLVRAGRRHPELADELVRVIIEGASPLELLAPGNLVKLLG
jgi:geranylgeranyl reductase family protein